MRKTRFPCTYEMQETFNWLLISEPRPITLPAVTASWLSFDYEVSSASTVTTGTDIYYPIELLFWLLSSSIEAAVGSTLLFCSCTILLNELELKSPVPDRKGLGSSLLTSSSSSLSAARSSRFLANDALTFHFYWSNYSAERLWLCEAVTMAER